MFQPEKNISPVLLGDSRQVNPYAWQVYVTLAFEYASVDYLAVHGAGFVLVEDLQVDNPVIHGDAITDIYSIDQVVVIDVDRRSLNVDIVSYTDGYSGAVLQLKFIGDIPGPNLRALGIQQYRNRGFEFAVQRANGFDHLRSRFMIPMGHVQAHNIHTGMGEFFQHRIRVGCGANGADNFGFAHGVRPLAGRRAPFY